jgi:hypothetical protein
MSITAASARAPRPQNTPTSILPHFKEQKWGRKNADSWPMLIMLGWWVPDYGQAGNPPARIQAYRPTNANLRRR